MARQDDSILFRLTCLTKRDCERLFLTVTGGELDEIIARPWEQAFEIETIELANGGREAA